jgi:hypothetical protein
VGAGCGAERLLVGDWVGRDRPHQYFHWDSWCPAAASALHEVARNSRLCILKQHDALGTHQSPTGLGSWGRWEDWTQAADAAVAGRGIPVKSE